MDTERNERNVVWFLTSTAIDFAALHGNGKKVKKNHKNYSEYRGLNIIRFDPLDPADNIYEAEVKKFNQMARDVLGLEEETIKYFIEKGPIFPELTDRISNQNLVQPKIDIIHSTYLPYNNIIYALLMARTYGCPCAITPFLHKENLRYRLSAIEGVLRGYDLIFACTPSEKKLYLEMGIEETKIKILPMGIEQKYYIPDHTALGQNLVKNTLPTILFTGYKNHEKGALTILRVIPLVTQNFGPANFIFIGPASTAFQYELAKLRPRLGESLIFNLSPDNLSGVYDKKKIGAFQHADIFCMPSRSDAYGIVYLEAWISKTPVIAADIPAMRDVVKHGVDGLLVPFDDPELLANAIGKLLNNPQLRRNMGEAGYQKVVKHNQWAAIAKQTYEYYRQLLSVRKCHREG